MLRFDATPHAARGQRGAALLEILVSILITSFGLLALAGLQTKMNSALMESYQRAQALALLQDMTQRLQANNKQDTAYVTSTYDKAVDGAVGKSDTVPGDCTTLVTPTRAQSDLCEWSNALKGAAEGPDANGDGSPDSNSGAMIDARGCVEQVQAANPATSVCIPAIYRVSVAWQGLNATVAPAVACGKDKYGSDDTVRKVISARVVIPLPSCS